MVSYTASWFSEIYWTLASVHWIELYLASPSGRYRMYISCLNWDAVTLVAIEFVSLEPVYISRFLSQNPPPKPWTETREYSIMMQCSHLCPFSRLFCRENFHNVQVASKQLLRWFYSNLNLFWECLVCRQDLELKVVIKKSVVGESIGKWRWWLTFECLCTCLFCLLAKDQTSPLFAHEHSRGATSELCAIPGSSWTPELPTNRTCAREAHKLKVNPTLA